MRYGYVGGDPVNRVDPTGLNFVGTVGTYQPSRDAYDDLLWLSAGIGIIFFAAAITLNSQAATGTYGNPGRIIDPDVVDEMLQGVEDGMKRLIEALSLLAAKGIEITISRADPKREDDEDKIFYFRQAGQYAKPGRSSEIIVSDLLLYQTPTNGISGVISHLEGAQKLFDRGNPWAINLLLGRKYEAERVLAWARSGGFISANSTAKNLDMIVNAAPILFVEVKWTEGNGLPSSTICCGRKSVVSEARQHASGTYLLEANALSAHNRAILTQNGGIELP